MQRQRIVRALELSSSLGAQTATLSAEDPVTAVVAYAREQNLSRVLVGRDHPRPWRPWYRSMADRIGHAAPDLDVVQVARNEDARTPVAPSTSSPTPGDWLAYLKAAAICAIATVLATPLAGALELTNIAMLFLLVVLIVAMRLGRGPAVVSAFLAVAAFDFFFVPPRFSFAVSDAQYLMTFAVMLSVALITGQLTARYKQHAEAAMQREARARALYEMARDLSAALLPVQIAEACDRFLMVEFGAQAALLLTDARDRLQVERVHARPGGGGTPIIDEGVARWAFDHGEAAGLSTDTLPGSPLLYLPLKAPMRTRGVLAISPCDPLRIQGPESRRQLETLTSLVAIAVERMHYVDVAQTTLLQMESESLRNSLLSAISHDLRTPLSVLVGLAESIRLTQPPPTDAQARIAETLREEALRISAKVNNLLDMARLQAGKVQLNRQWQPLEEVVGSALEATEGFLGAHSVATALPDDLPLLEIDGVLIERVLCNLLENAAKYTPQGTPLSIGAALRESEVEVYVDDNGPGLPKGREEAIFQKFERGTRASTTPGVGLGLAICRAIVEAHGGRIRAENRVTAAEHASFSGCRAASRRRFAQKVHLT
jgi:two-component system sensor histidine kinase KdpD